MSELTPQAASAAQQEERGIRVALEQARLVWKHRLLVLAIASAVSVFAAIWTIRQPQIYEAAVAVEFDPNPPRPLGHQFEEVTDEGVSYWSSREYYNTQYRIIESQHVAQAVVRQLGLQHDADFLRVPPQQRRNFHSVSVEAAAAILQSRMRVEPIRDSRLVQIHVEDTVPRRAQLLANTIATVYIRQNLEAKLSTTVSALEWLGQQLESLRTQLEGSELALHEYRRQNNLLSVSYEDRRNHVSNRIEKLSNGLTEAQEQRIAIAARVTELRRAVATSDPLQQQAPELLESAILSQLREQYENARRSRDSLATRYGPSSQQLLAAESALAELRDAMHHEGQNILGAAEAHLRTSRRIESELQTALADAQRQALELNLREIEYGRLQRERENNAKLYGIVLERTKETDLARLLRVNNIRVLDEALVPGGPIKPRVWVNIVSGVMGGLLLGILAALGAVLADRSVRSQSDVQEVLGATFLGVMPSIGSAGRLRYRYGYGSNYGQTKGGSTPVTNPDLVVHTHPMSAAAEACRVIRTNLLFMSPDEPLRVLLVSSASAREGKTTVAVNLATALAQSGKKVLLVDTDLRRPRVHRVFGMRPPVGITSVLVNEVTLDEALIDSEVPNLTVLPCGPIPPNPAELLHSQRFIDLLGAVRNRFDRVILDTPPIGAVSDALVLAPQVDGSILVVRARKTPRARAVAILSQLRVLGARIAGVILNDVDLDKEGGATYYYAGSDDYSSVQTRESA